jgi:hypothetical protein
MYIILVDDTHMYVSAILYKHLLLTTLIKHHCLTYGNTILRRNSFAVLWIRQHTYTFPYLNKEIRHKFPYLSKQNMSLKMDCSKDIPASQPSLSGKLVAGGVAGVLGTLAIFPIDFVKTNMQASY